MPPSGPTFWSLIGEVYPAKVDGLFAAQLMTGVVQTTATITLAANTTYYALQGADSVVDEGIIAPLRLRAPYAIRKSTLKGLDDMIPNWEQATPATQIISWFPLGVSYFGIYPQLSVETQVEMDFLTSPVNEARPYSGTETIPFPVQFNDLATKYAAALLRIKEGGSEADESGIVLETFLEDVRHLSLWQARLDSLNFSGAFGGKISTNPKTAV